MLTDEEILQRCQDAGFNHREMHAITRVHWKDGIGIRVPTVALRSFVETCEARVDIMQQLAENRGLAHDEDHAKLAEWMAEVDRLRRCEADLVAARDALPLCVARLDILGHCGNVERNREVLKVAKAALGPGEAPHVQDAGGSDVAGLTGCPWCNSVPVADPAGSHKRRVYCANRECVLYGHFINFDRWNKRYSPGQEAAVKEEEA